MKKLAAKGSLLKCQLCGVYGNAAATVDPDFQACSNHETGVHLWSYETKEREYKPRVIKYQIKLKKSPGKPSRGEHYPRTIARWDKKNGLLWRIAIHPAGYGADPLDNYWKVTEANPSAINSAIQQVGKYLSEDMIGFDAATELLDLLNQALARKLAP